MNTCMGKKYLVAKYIYSSSESQRHVCFFSNVKICSDNSKMNIDLCICNNSVLRFFLELTEIVNPF